MPGSRDVVVAASEGVVVVLVLVLVMVVADGGRAGPMAVGGRAQPITTAGDAAAEGDSRDEEGGE